MQSSSRRRFLRNSAWLSAAAAAMPVRSWAQVPGANSEIRVAVVGFRQQGRVHIEGFRKTPGCRVVALCDADSEVLAREAKRFADRGEAVATFSDVRRLLESREVDVIATATPNHWHSLITVWACQAGKDVYVEKPVSHNVWEGRKMVEAARKYERIVQTGTQSRSSTGIREAIQWLHAGNLGAIRLARGLCYKRRPTLGRVNGPQPIPASVDYELWCGPAAKAPLRRYKLHYDWHWVWNTGNGDIGNQGIHEMDLARWALGETAVSPLVMSVGGRFGYEDDGETPNTQVVMHYYQRAPLFFEVRGLPERSGTERMPAYRGVSIGVVVECEGGSLVIRANEALACDTNGGVIRKFGDHRARHFANFIEAVRLRNYGYLHADILEGHISSALCHTGNISHRLGLSATAEMIREQILGDADAAEAFARMEEHLKTNAVDLVRTRAALGPLLVMDPAAESFDDARANEHLRRSYRRGFAVPETV
jgi:predicted dehydrogenase